MPRTLIGAAKAPSRSVFGQSRVVDSGARESVALRRAELQAKLAASYVSLWERNEVRARRALEQAQTEQARWQARLVEFTARVSALQSAGQTMAQRTRR